MTSYGYTPVPGSADLVTRPRPEQGPVAELEALDPAAPGGRHLGGEWLGRAVVRAGHVPVLLDVYDRLALDQEPEEQALYGHLYRLALGEERNWCRVSRRELCTRTRLSDRRLGKALAGLVAKGHVRLMERDKRGTLYRVRLPHEVFGEPDHDHVQFPGAGAAKRAPAPAAAAPRQAAAAAAGRKPEARPPAKRAAQTLGSNDTLSKSQTVGEVAAAFVERFGEGRGRSRAEVVEEVLGLLEDGYSLAEAQEALLAFGAKAPRQTPLSELGRFLVRRG